MGDGNKVAVHVEALPDKGRLFTWKDGRNVYNSMAKQISGDNMQPTFTVHRGCTIYYFSVFALFEWL